MSKYETYRAMKATNPFAAAAFRKSHAHEIAREEQHATDLAALTELQRKTIVAYAPDDIDEQGRVLAIVKSTWPTATVPDHLATTPGRMARVLGNLNVTDDTTPPKTA